MKKATILICNIVIVFLAFASQKSSMQTKKIPSSTPTLSTIPTKIYPSIQERKVKFEPAKKLLLEKSVPFEPKILLSSEWKQKIMPIQNRNDV